MRQSHHLPRTVDERRVARRLDIIIPPSRLGHVREGDEMTAPSDDQRFIAVPRIMGRKQTWQVFDRQRRTVVGLFETHQEALDAVAARQDEVTYRETTS